MNLLVNQRTNFAKHQFRYYKTVSYVYGHRESPIQAEFIEMPSEPKIKNCNLYSYVEHFRNHGYRYASLEPLTSIKMSANVEAGLSPILFGLDINNYQDFAANNIVSVTDSTDKVMNLAQLTQYLQRCYCGSIGLEFSHLTNPAERFWLSCAMEKRFQSHSFSATQRLHMAYLLQKTFEVDRFLASKFGSVKRYGAEGCESMTICFDELLKGAVTAGIQHSVVAFSHRGRNNFLMALLNYPPARFFRKMLGGSEFSAGEGATGDTFSHYHTSTQIGQDNKFMTVSVIPNPSFLEANIPVAMGKARSKMQTYRDGDYNLECKSARNGDHVACILVHGDASVVGQGVVAESLALAYTPHFSVGGSVHVVINNRLGFTTPSHYGSSFSSCCDVAKALNCPVIHVNGEDVEEVARASRIALDYRQEFRKDVFLDLICYRRHGHNELDEPRFTQPLMYAAIDKQTPLPEFYRSQLLADPSTKDEIETQVDALLNRWREHLDNELIKAKSTPEMEQYVRQAQWSDIKLAQAGQLTTWDTGVDLWHLRNLALASVATPNNFQVHATLLRSHVARRLECAGKPANEHVIDWATAEILAIGSLLNQGFSVRLCGQDVGRGTFSHRHCQLVCQRTDQLHIPLNHLTPDQSAYLEVANSLLSEEAVLGFEIGMAMDRPDRLVIWEAQFGDFFTGAQIMIDTYLSSAETKWAWQQALVLLLPHGMDGAGPEHSSCRLERFLQLTDSAEERPDDDRVNLTVVNPSTPAQYFHALRRQLARPFRKPMVVVAPKMLLRHPQCQSSLEQFQPGCFFHHVLDDLLTKDNPGKVRHVVFCSGKHYYTLIAARDALPEQQRVATAFIRLEQISPFPVYEIAQLLRHYSAAQRIVWAQEEHRNAGAWSFVSARMRSQLHVDITYAGRPELASPAVGIAELHRNEVSKLTRDALNW